MIPEPLPGPEGSVVSPRPCRVPAATSFAASSRTRTGRAVLLGFMLWLLACAELTSAAVQESEVLVDQMKVGGKPVNDPVEVRILLPEAPEPERRPLRIKDRLPLGAELIVPSRTVIGLFAPVQSNILLSPGARFRVNSPRMVEVREGKAMFNVKKLLDFFNVEYEGFAALVRGTRFSVEVIPGREVVCELTEGLMRVERSARVRIDEGSRTAEVSEITTLDPRKNSRVVYSLKQDAYLRQFGTFAEAESYYRARLDDALQDGNFDTVQGARNDLGSILMTIGRPAEAVPLFVEGAAAAESRHDLPWQARMLNNLGGARLALRDFRGAIPALEQALAINLALYPDGIQKRIAHNNNNLGLAYRGLGDPQRAAGYFEQALRVNRAIWRDGKSKAIAGNLGNLGMTRLQMGDTVQGLAALREALALLQSLYPDGRHPDLGNAYFDLGTAYLSLGDSRAALTHLRQALSVRKALFPDQDHPAVAESLGAYGRALTLAGSDGFGVRLQEEGLAMQRRLHPEGTHSALVPALRQLAASLHERGNAVRAAELDREADTIEARRRGAQ